MNELLNSDLDKLRQICGLFPEAEEGLLQDRPLFHVRRRRFAIYNCIDAPYRKRWEGFGRSLHFATSPDQKVHLSADTRFVESPHHGFRGWMSVGLDDESNWRELNDLLLFAYRHVANKKLIAQLEGR